MHKSKVVLDALLRLIFINPNRTVTNVLLIVS